MADAVPQPAVRGWRFWAFIGFMLALMALFIALGTWQVERLGEKERLIADVAARANLPPEAVPAAGEWAALDPDAVDFRAVTLAGRYVPSGTVLVFTSLSEQHGAFSGPGYWVLTPFELEAGGTVFVNRGFIRDSDASAFASGQGVTAEPTTLTGTLRRAEAIGAFTPATDMAKRVEWVRNPARLATLAGDLPQPVAPFYVDLPAGAPRSLPQGGETVMEFPNNHLGYAATWYGFAVLVPFLLWFWVRRQRVG